MKNKGFAVTAALYGMVILFVTVMFCLLSMFRDYRSMNKSFVDSIKGGLNTVMVEPTINVTFNSQEETDSDYPYLKALTITITNSNDISLPRKIKITSPPEQLFAIISGAYTENTENNTFKIKSCDNTSTFPTTCGGGEEYDFSASGFGGKTNGLEITPNATENYIEIPVNLANGDKTYVFYLRFSTANDPTVTLTK